MFAFQGFNQFVNNYQQNMQKMGVPFEIMNNPNSIIQYLMNNGKLSQQQYNNAVQQMNALQKTPNFLQSLSSFFNTPR